MDLVIASDHAGLDLGREIIKELQNDFNIISFFPEGKADYPDYAKMACDEVLARSCFGILICGSGLGMSMCANKISGIRAALCLNEYLARFSRAHNNANVLCLGARVVGVGVALEIVRIFLSTDFEGGRHARRVCKMDAMK